MFSNPLELAITSVNVPVLPTEHNRRPGGYNHHCNIIATHRSSSTRDSARKSTAPKQMNSLRFFGIERSGTRARKRCLIIWNWHLKPRNYLRTGKVQVEPAFTCVLSTFLDDVYINFTIIRHFHVNNMYIARFLKMTLGALLSPLM